MNEVIMPLTPFQIVTELDRFECRLDELPPDAEVRTAIREAARLIERDLIRR